MRVSAPPALAGTFFAPEPPGEPECSLPSLCFSHSKRAPDTCLPFSLFPVYVDYQGFPGGTRGEESSCNAGDVGSIPGSGRCPGRGHGNPLQYSCLENPWARSLVGYIPWGCKESDTTKVTSHAGTHSWDYVWTLYSAIDTYVCFYSSIKLL